MRAKLSGPGQSCMRSAYTPDWTGPASGWAHEERTAKARLAEDEALWILKETEPENRPDRECECGAPGHEPFTGAYATYARLFTLDRRERGALADALATFVAS